MSGEGESLRRILKKNNNEKTKNEKKNEKKN